MCVGGGRVGVSRKGLIQGSYLHFAVCSMSRYRGNKRRLYGNISLKYQDSFFITNQWQAGQIIEVKKCFEEPVPPTYVPLHSVKLSCFNRL